MKRCAKLAAALAGIGALLAPGAGGTAESDELYRATAIVTGTGAVNRRLGLALCLDDVLVKVSGDPRLLGDPRVAALAKRAATLVSAFTYRDRLAHRPIRDEQGTRDRPHDLTVTFDRAKIDAALAALGRKPWTGPRPRLVVFVGVDNGAAKYALAADGERGPDQRDALAAAAQQIAIPIVLPNRAALTAAGVSYDGVAAPDLAKLDAAAKASGGERALVGRLTWSDHPAGWIADWQFADAGKTHRWRIRGVSFDDTFRNGLRGTAQILSGNGAPK
ncbi:MAG TPA: DUF2066 domain-containing protein [Alphaproteobacteria bacterium]